MATPIKGGHSHPHRLPDDGDKKRKRDGAGGAEDPTAAAHVDKKAAKRRNPLVLSKEHQAYVTSFITELHATATTSFALTRAVNLSMFFQGKKVELLAKKEEKLSSLAAFRFVHSNPELKQKAIEGFEILDYLSWQALQTAAAWSYDPSAEPRIREEVEAFCAIAKDSCWDKDVIMEHVVNQNPKELVKHIFPEAKIT